uniref:Piezo non-specific cation channel R-Ras-binding domain-containing protein n=1 Tax=Panagrolaimus superbus TaxID=310955 RepID=A0A914Y1Z1_9BILA
MSKKERLKFAYDQFKTNIKEYAMLLAMFLGMFARGTIESLISYLMTLSRDYRYIAYILQEEKRIHKELFNASMDVDEHVSKVTRHQQRAMIREKLQEKYGKSGFLKDEGIRKLHQYVEETEEREDSEAFDAPLPEIVTEVIKEELEAEKVIEEEQAIKEEEALKDSEAEAKALKEEEGDVVVSDSEVESRKSVVGLLGRKKESIASKMSKDSILSKGSSKTSKESILTKTSVESKEVAVITPAIIVQHDSEDDTTTVVHVPQAIVEIPRGSSTPSQAEFRKIVDEAERQLSPPITKPTKEEYLFVRLIIAFYYAILSRSELICYIMIILNHIHSASFLSMPLPFMMLLWGTLNVPLPTKQFWITVITYTEAMVIIKYVFQFGFFPWNSSAPSLDPFWLPRILGIEKNPHYAMWDLVLLMTLFLHRNILMATGLWKNTEKHKSEDDSISSDESEKDEISKASNASLQLSPPIVPKERKGSLFSRRRLTQISFSSVTNKFRRERIKRKWVSFNGFDKSLLPTNNPNNPYNPHHVRFSFINDFDVIVRLPSTDSDSSVTHKVTKVRGFFGILLHPVNRVPIDMYAPMFLCDIICFLIVIFGYSDFGTDQGGGSVAAYFEENKVPGTLVAMLIIQFVLIVTDRALFLRKFLFGKLCFQLLLVIFIHIWIFFLLPAATDRLFCWKCFDPKL